MPILYQNKPNIMKNWTEITKEEFEYLKKIKTQYEWTNNDMMGVVNFSKTYVNPRTPSCLSCSGNFRETLNSVREYYLLHKDEIEQNLNNQNGTTKE